MSGREDLVRRAHDYVNRTGRALGQQLGSGVHGIVFAVESQTEPGCAAIKVHEREPGYCRERDVYLRLRERGISEIRGCAVPEMLAYDDGLLIIEMTIVVRPFVLDFAGAYLDHAPDFSEETLADWRADKQDQFGSSWPEVEAILRALEGQGIYMEDVSPGNIAFDR
jgi:hypothetical protein